jgi:peptidoglycan/xylan/chitin deacetylase (PgdA/CDA1 family)
MKQAGYAATVYISTRNTTFDGYMNWDDIALVAKEGWEIGAHTYTHPNLTKLTDEEIVGEFEISNDDYLQHGYRPTSFATPFGAYDDRVLEVIMRYYESHRTAWPAGSNTLQSDPYQIVSFDINRNTTIEEVTQLLESLQKNGGWVVFQLHHLFPEGGAVTEEYGTSLLGEILMQVQTKQIAVLTVSDALKQLKKE